MYSIFDVNFMHKIWNVKSNGNCKFYVNLERNYFLILLISYSYNNKKDKWYEYKWYEYKRNENSKESSFFKKKKKM